MSFALASANGETWIAAEGLIVDDTDAAFAHFLSEIDEIPETVVLHSTGGRLAAGLALGRMIRAEGLATRVGDTTGCGGGAETRVAPGLCASSCAYAFLGGSDRQLGLTGQLGFHRIYPSPGQGQIAPEILASATAAAMEGLRAYIIEMGANPRLTDIADQIAADGLFMPQGQLLWVLGIETGPIAVASDTAEALTLL